MGCSEVGADGVLELAQRVRRCSTPLHFLPGYAHAGLLGAQVRPRCGHPVPVAPKSFHQRVLDTLVERGRRHLRGRGHLEPVVVEVDRALDADLGSGRDPRHARSRGSPRGLRQLHRVECRVVREPAVGEPTGPLQHDRGLATEPQRDRALNRSGLMPAALTVWNLPE